MAEEKDILKKFDVLKNNEQFKVPEGYFNALPNKVLERVKEEQPEVNNRKPAIFKLVRNQLAIAASFAALFMLSYAAINIVISKTEKNSLSEGEIYASLESEIHDLDESLLYSLANNKNTSVESNNNLTEEDIIEYLVNEGVDFDLTNNDF